MGIPFDSPPTTVAGFTCGDIRDEVHPLNENLGIAAIKFYYPTTRPAAGYAAIAFAMLDGMPAFETAPNALPSP